MELGISQTLARHRLDNGLRVVVHPDPTLPLAAVNLWYHVGSRNERPGRTGFAHLFEHMLFQGSQHVGTNDHFRHLQSVGGVANGSTWYDRTNYYETVPVQHLDLALWLESDRMGFLLPALDQKKLDTQRDVVMNERRQRVDNQPYGRPYERLFELLFPRDHPYHWPVIGTMADIQAATLEDVQAFFRTYYLPRNAVLTIAGDVRPEDAFERVERWFGALPHGPEPPSNDFGIGPLEGGTAETVEDNVQLPRVYLAFRVEPYGRPEWYASALLATLLGDGKSSPLYDDLVYRRRIAQDVSCYAYPTEACGVFVAAATARPQVRPEELAESLWRHLESAANVENLSEHLERARNSTLATLCGQFETLENRADLLSMFTTLWNRPEAAWSEPDRYLEVTPEAIAATARDALQRDHGVELTVVPRGAAT